MVFSYAKPEREPTADIVSALASIRRTYVGEPTTDASGGVMFPDDIAEIITFSRYPPSEGLSRLAYLLDPLPKDVYEHAITLVENLLSTIYPLDLPDDQTLSSSPIEKPPEENISNIDYVSQWTHVRLPYAHDPESVQNALDRLSAFFNNLSY